MALTKAQSKFVKFAAKGDGDTTYLTASFSNRIRKWYMMGQDVYDRDGDLYTALKGTTDAEKGGFWMGYNARKYADENGLQPSVIGGAHALTYAGNRSVFGVETDY